MVAHPHRAGIQVLVVVPRFKVKAAGVVGSDRGLCVVTLISQQVRVLAAEKDHGRVRNWGALSSGGPDWPHAWVAEHARIAGAADADRMDKLATSAMVSATSTAPMATMDMPTSHGDRPTTRP